MRAEMRRIMRKNKIFTGILIFAVIAVTACGKSGKVKVSKNTSENNLNAIIGGGGRNEIVLDADEIVVKKAEVKYTDAVQNLIEGKNGYKKENKQLILEIKAVMAGNKAYISMQPLFQWDAEKGEVGTEFPSLIVFSENYDKAWRIGLMWEKGKYVYHDTGELESKIYSALMSEKQEYIYLGAYEQEELLSEQNELIEITGMNSNTVTVKGDYFKAVKESGIVFSMKKLKENVVEVEK